MQVFLPYETFARCASVLDNKRLHAQFYESHRILSAILGLSDAWKNHCVTRMWTKHAYWLFSYASIIQSEILKRGHSGIFPDKLFEICMALPETGYPKFLTNSKIHSAYRAHLLATYFNFSKRPSAYRAHLLAKVFNFYKQFGWEEQPVIGYYAPDKNNIWVKYPDKKELLGENYG